MAGAIGLLTAIIILIITFKPIFRNSKGFRESIGYWIKPDIISLLDGEHHRDMMAEGKLAIWLVLGGGGGFMAAMVVNSIF